MWVVETANGQALAICELVELDYWFDTGEDWLRDARWCGHPRAAGWVKHRLPLRARRITEAEREEILEDGMPALQRVPDHD